MSSGGGHSAQRAAATGASVRCRRQPGGVRGRVVDERRAGLVHRHARRDRRAPAQSGGYWPRAAVKRSTRPLSSSIASSALSCAARELGRLANVLLGRAGSSSASSWRAPSRSPPCASVVAASGRIHSGALGNRAARSNQRGGRVVVAGVPVVDEPDVVRVLPARSGLRASPFSSSAIAWSARPGPSGGAIDRKMAPNRYAILNCGSSVVVRSSSGCSSSKRPVVRARLAVAPVVLDRANPVDVGRERVERQEQAVGGLAGRAGTAAARSPARPGTRLARVQHGSPQAPGRRRRRRSATSARRPARSLELPPREDRRPRPPAAPPM